MSMKVFNAAQLTLLFMAFPFILNWLAYATFPLAGVALFCCACGYLVQTIWTICIYADSFGD